MTTTLSLLDIINAELASDDLRLPVYPAVATRVQQLAARPSTGADALEAVLVQDPALASQILRVANSAFYAGLNPVDTIKLAVLRLGFAHVVNLAVLCSQRGQFTSPHPQVQALMSRLWQHSVGCALGARWLAHRCGYRARADEAFMAGLFHDIGKLLILKVVDDVRQRGEWSQDLPEALLLELLRTQHAEQGAKLIARWNLPAAYATIARTHHDPDPDQADALALIVRLTNQTCTKLGLNLYTTTDVVLAASPEAAALGLKDVVIAELELMLEDEAATFMA